MKEEQLHILRHSLGIQEDGRGNEHRNHYAADPNPDLIALCALGYMVDRGAVAMWGGMHGYQVTDSGKEFVRTNKPPPLSPSRQRYLDYLRADSGLTFIQWLRARKGR